MTDPILPMPLRPPKISTLLFKLTGSSFVRCFAPVDWMTRHGKAKMLPYTQGFAADVVLFHGLWFEDSLEVMRSLQRHGVRCIVDLDDQLFAVPQANPAYQEYASKHTQTSILRMLGEADEVTVSTDLLQEIVWPMRSRYKKASASVVVVPNGLDIEGVWKPVLDRVQSDERPVCIGMALSSSHAADTQILRGVFQALHQKYGNKIFFRFLGHWPAWMKEELPPEAWECQDFVDIESYPQTLRDMQLDIGLAPLADLPFNEARSNLKVMEYAAAGAVTVASKIGPYKYLDGGNGIAVRNRTKDWVQAISSIVDAHLQGMYRWRSMLARARQEIVPMAAVADRFEAVLSSLQIDYDRKPYIMPVASTERTRKITVIVPVHNQRELTERCLNATLPDAQASGYRVLVVNDGSDEETSAWLEQNRDKYELVSHPVAQGFVAAVNAGIQAAAPDDVILLNSDTVPSPGFISRLAEAAYTHPRIGTVTAVTNNGSIASIPWVHDVSELTQSGEQGLVRTPTAVGHCVYIKREVLDKHGAFDMAFSPGYGEENEFSLRIRQDYDSVIDPGCYVYHEGGKSFGSSRQKLQNQHAAEISKRYPHYSFEVLSFYHADPLRPHRRRILEHTSDQRPRVLHVAHSYATPAGTEKHVQELVDALRTDFLNFVAAPDGASSLNLFSDQTVVLGSQPYTQVPWPLTPTATDGSRAAWRRILEEVRPDLVHIHHLHRHPLGLLEDFCTSGIPTCVSLHDHYLLCPDWTLLGCPGLDQCQNCFPKRFGGHINYQTTRRQIIAENLRKAAAVLAPSSYIAGAFRTMYDCHVHVIPHGTDPLPVQRVPSRTGNLRFAYLGNVTNIKGADVLLRIIDQMPEGTEISIFGACEPRYANRLLGTACYRGPYTQQDLPRILSEIDIGIIPSVVPESFCYTLSEFASAGIPCIVSDLGALGERIAHEINGWKVPPGNVDALLRQIAQVRFNAQVTPPSVPSVAGMANQYGKIYRDILSN